jgi:hypothetical protein
MYQIKYHQNFRNQLNGRQFEKALDKLLYRLYFLKSLRRFLGEVMRSKSLVLHIFSIILLVVIACTTKDGIEFETFNGQLLIVSAQTDSARIFLDYRDTGHLTPALITDVTPGHHVIHLFRSGYRSNPDSVVVSVEENITDTVSIELNSSPSGNLNIDSAPDSARVFLNKLEFGLTPLQLDGLPIGVYILQIVKSNFDIISDTLEILENDNLQLVYQLQEDLRRFVLLEHFSNTSCPPCPTSDAIIDNLADLYGPTKLIILGYHANYPSPADPMYLSARTDNDSRIQFYQPPALPRAYVDGRLVLDPLSEISYQNLIESQLLQDTSLTISFQQLNRTDTLVKGQLEVRALEGMSEDHRLYLALIEDEIDYSSPPGNNGQTHFEAVLRSFYPDGNGIVINLVAFAKQKINFEFTLKSEWGSDLTVLAFVQNPLTKMINQSGWTRYPEF